MARKPRFYLKEVPCHVVQRGNNRQVCFYTNDDFAFYMHSLHRALQHYEVRLHGFVLMTNHVHLLMTPCEATGISRVMQSVGRDYVRYINKQHGRSGTLFEGRHKASLIDSELYLLQCLRYIELNPVRAKMVARPAQYHWSSYQYHGAGRLLECLTPHPLYLGLGADAVSRCLAYQGLFSNEISHVDLSNIRQSLAHNYPLGTSHFCRQLELTLGRPIGQCEQGRPARAVACEK